MDQQTLFQYHMIFVGVWYGLLGSLISNYFGGILTTGFLLLVLGALTKKLIGRLPFVGATCNFVIGVGLLLMVAAFFASSIFPYGHDSATGVAQLASRIETHLLTFPPSQPVFLSAPISSAGHRYVALNPLPCKREPTPLYKNISQNLDLIFPFHAKSPNGDTSIKLGKEFTLGFRDPSIFSFPPVENDVIVSHLGLNEFTLKTEDGPGHSHALRGTAAHGVVRDNTGRLWLFQIGAGPTNEPGYQQLMNYGLARDMWAKMAANISEHYGAAC